MPRCQFLKVVLVVCTVLAASLRAEAVPDSPLCHAIYRGQADLVALMVENGADPNLVDSDGFSPLMYAAMYGQVDVAKVLMAKGARIEQADEKNGATPLIMAAQYGHLEMVTLLLTLGASVEPTDKVQKLTAAQWARSQGHFDIAVLLENGPTPNTEATPVPEQKALTPETFLNSGKVNIIQKDPAKQLVDHIVSRLVLNQGNPKDIHLASDVKKKRVEAVIKLVNLATRFESKVLASGLIQSGELQRSEATIAQILRLSFASIQTDHSLHNLMLMTLVHRRVHNGVKVDRFGEYLEDTLKVLGDLDLDLKKLPTSTQDQAVAIADELLQSIHSGAPGS